MRLLILIIWLAAAGNAFAMDADAAPRYAAPVLHWSSKEEKGVYGYIIYRSLKADGPYLRVNERIIPVPRAKDPDSSGGEKSNVERRYEYVDASANPAEAYYYYIDAVSTTGLSQRLTKPTRRVPRLQPSE